MLITALMHIKRFISEAIQANKRHNCNIGVKTTRGWHRQLVADDWISQRHKDRRGWMSNEIGRKVIDAASPDPSTGSHSATLSDLSGLAREDQDPNIHRSIFYIKK